MKRNFFQLGMGVILFGGLIGALMSVIFLSPYTNIETLEKSPVSIIVFYFCLLLFFTGVFSLMLLWIRRKTSPDIEVQDVNTGVSFRQGFLLAVVLVVMLVLQSLRILVWWDALLVIGAIVMIELYFLAR